MADQPPYPATDDDPGLPPQRQTGRPRWLSVIGISLAVAVVLLIVVLHLTGTIGPNSH